MLPQVSRTTSNGKICELEFGTLLRRYQHCPHSTQLSCGVLQIGVTNDRKHDTYSTQHFMERMQQWWRSFREPVKSLFIHSDNASQHFKSSKTMNFLSRLPKLPGWQNATGDSIAAESATRGPTENEKIAHWSFGCPGHGKVLHSLIACVDIHFSSPPSLFRIVQHCTPTDSIKIDL
jgi:hypothetical protein